MKYSLPTIVVLVFCVTYFSCESNDDSRLTNTNEVNQNVFPDDDDKDIIFVSNVPELMATTRLTNDGNKVVIIKDGVYELSERLWITGNNITYRSHSENRNKVIIKGRGINGSTPCIFDVLGKKFAIKDITLCDVSLHGILVHGDKNADSIYVKNVHFINIGAQMFKTTFNKDNSDYSADNGIIEDCLFEYSINKKMGKNRGGIDINHGKEWLVSNCKFENISNPTSTLTHGAINFRNFSEYCTIERNTIMNCDKGIIFGFDNKTQTGGIIRNNMIHVIGEAGIYICSAYDVKVYNNTVYNASNYCNAIEYKHTETHNTEIANNLTNKAIASRDNAMAFLENNITNAEENWFKNASRGNLHLTKNISKAISTTLNVEVLPKGSENNERSQYISYIGANKKR